MVTENKIKLHFSVYVQNIHREYYNLSYNINTNINNYWNKRIKSVTVKIQNSKHVLSKTEASRETYKLLLCKLRKNIIHLQYFKLYKYLEIK